MKIVNNYIILLLVGLCILITSHYLQFNALFGIGLGISSTGLTFSVMSFIEDRKKVR